MTEPLTESGQATAVGPSLGPAGASESASSPVGREAFARGIADVAAVLRSDPATGLSEQEAAARLGEHGPNELRPARARSLPGILWESAREPFVVLLAAAGALAVALGEVRDGLLVLAGLVPIVGADAFTAYRGERALEALRVAAAPMARVRRDSRVRDLPARELVPGDIVLLRSGDVVPADVRLSSAHGLAIDRSILTGESVPEPASVEADLPGAQMLDRRSMAYAGTSVVSGRGEGIVVAAGAATELGRIASGLDPGAERRRSPLQRELDRLVRLLLIVAIGLIVLTAGLGFLRGRSLGENVLAGISAAIAAIPEEPPVLLAVVAGLGAFRLLRRGVLVRRLSAQETLGAVDLIVTDKTGTLTQNRLELRAILDMDGPVTDPATARRLLSEALRAEEDAWHLEAGAAPGSFTRAILAALESRGGRVALHGRDLEAAEPPADGRPYARVVDRFEGRREELLFGAPESVLAAVGDRLGSDERDTWHLAVGRRADSGGRLLLLARRLGDEPWVLRALFDFADPLRPGVVEALRAARSAGIQTLVVTGDHPGTAAAIAREAGLTVERIVTGEELDRWSDERLRAELRALDIVARAVPEQKLRLVQAARATGRTVAVTGDGVNDAPALQRADVGVAMGSGTAVAREASDLVLGDDSFATLVQGLAEGRRIVANVQKGLVFITSTHVALLGFILLATLVGFDQPLLPIQILWLELFIDLSTSVAFEREPAERDAMRRPPRPRDRPLLDLPILGGVTLAGAFSAVSALVLLAPWWSRDLDHARWLAFTALVAAQVVRAYANRSLEVPLRRLPPNALLAVAAIGTLLIQALIPVVPPLAEAFRAVALSPVEWLAVAAIAGAPVLVAEAIRTIPGRRWIA